MKPAAIPAELLAAAPGIAGRLGLILAALAALIAHAFLRDPRRVGIIVPLWTRITRAARRFARLIDRLPAGIRLRGPRASRPGRAGGPPPATLPAAHGWLVAELGYRAAGYRSQLDHLLAEPETAALLAQLPQAARILRPICRMLGVRHASLGVRHASLRLPPAPTRTARPAAPPCPAPRPHAETRPMPVFLQHGEPHNPPPRRPTLPDCPRLRERWPWNTLPAADPA